MSSVLDILDFAGFLLFDTVPCSPGWLVILFLSLPCAVITSLHHQAHLDCMYPSVCTAHAVVSVDGGRGCSMAEQHKKIKTVSRKSSVYLEKSTHSRLLPAKNLMPEILLSPPLLEFSAEPVTAGPGMLPRQQDKSPLLSFPFLSASSYLEFLSRRPLT